MTDPVDTDALRDLQALSGGILSRQLLRGSGVWKMNRDVTEALGSAADEVDRLRAEMVKALREIRASSSEAQFERERAERYEREMTTMYALIENAPHADDCAWWNTDPPAPCTCWKADAL